MEKILPAIGGIAGVVLGGTLIWKVVLRNFRKAPGLYIRLRHYAKHSDAYSEEEKYKYIQRIMQLAVRSGNIQLQVHGKENIPSENGFLLYGNHQGLFDIVALAVSCDAPLAAVYKKELNGIPVPKEIFACTNSFAMDRENIRRSLPVIQQTAKEVANGRNYLIFPEGTRSRNQNQLAAFHGGSFRCALSAKCTIVPFVLIDSFTVLDQNGSKPVKVQLHYLEPIPYEEYKDLKSAALSAMVKDRIQQVMDLYAA